MNRFEVNKKFIPPTIRICHKCDKLDIPCIIKENKYIYEICDRCGNERKIGLFNKYNLEALGYKIK